MLRHAFSIQHFRQRLAHTEALPQMVVLGIMCGLICGIVLGVFRLLLELPLSYFLPSNDYENFEGLSQGLRFILPIIGSLILIALFSQIPKHARKVGVVHLLERMAYHQGHLPFKNACVQFAATIIALTFGHTAGKEGPAIHIGAACSSQLGQQLKLPNNTLRILAGCGCAAAIAATFNTPLAGVIFAMEVVLLEYTVIGFIPVIVAAVTGTLVVQFMLGRELLLNVPSVSLQSLHEIPYIIVLGIVIGLLAAFFIKLLALSLSISHHSRFTFRSKLLLAGILTGLVAVFFPQVMGIGYDTLEQVFQDELGLTLLAAILIAKCLLTPVVLGLGLPGGLIGPGFFIGALAGGLIGSFIATFIDQSLTPSGFYAMLGMGSMMAAITNAPLAALIGILELSGNPNIIFPAMISIVISNLVTRYFFKTPSAFLVGLKINGMDYRFTPLNQVLARSAVTSQMTTNFIKTAPNISTQGANTMLASKPEWLLIEQEDDLTLLSPGDLDAVLLQEADSEFIDLLAIPALRLDSTSITDQATLEEALNLMTEANVEALCINNTQQQVIGLITRSQIEAHYRQN